MTARAIGIDEVITAAHSPWQNAYAERLIGSIRRECLDHIIVCSQTGLRRTLQAYSEYYQLAAGWFGRSHRPEELSVEMKRPMIVFHAA